MLGKEDRQTSFFDTGFACSHLIDKKSFYAKMRECGFIEDSQGRERKMS